MKSLEIVFPKPNQVDLREGDVPDPGPDDLLIQTTCVLISTGTECTCLRGQFDPGTSWAGWVKYPFQPGYSLVGRVIKKGSAVKDFQEGDRVTCPVKHAQFALCSAAQARLIPDGVSDQEASWATLSYITQHGFRKAKLRLGEVVVVVGLGMLGQLIVQYARAAGAGEVIAIDTALGRLQLATAHGATAAISKPVSEAVDELKRLTGGRLADVVFDMTGHPDAFATALKLPRRFGRFVLVGDVANPSQQRLAQDVIMRDITILGAHATNPTPQPSDWAGYWSQNHMVQLFFQFLLRKQMRVSDLVTHRFPAPQAAEAYDLLMTRRSEAMGVILDHWQD
ncbi:MAG: zinc-binding dehydrogenase [Phycisphaeraceae bacterium]|nr:zinc-binding dehydrogenase [Phycisphaeraceae bacterium]